MSKKINWKDYNKALVNRGKITLWFPKDADKSWYAPPSGKRGSSYRYSDAAIESLSLLRFKFGLTLRALQGFAQSLFGLMGLKIEVPDYTTLCRRLGKLSPKIKRMIKEGRPIHVVMDSTGLKVYGDGEWNSRQHGPSKRRTWRKLHLAVDESNSQIVGAALSDNSFKDNELFEDLVDAIDGEITQISADGAYDSRDCYEKSLEEGINLVTPPRRDGRIKNHGNCAGPPHPRDIHLREIRAFGRKQWKEKSGYHRRSLAETGMYRFKVLVGDKLSSRDFNRQANEAIIKCQILNRMPVPSALAS